MNAREYPAGVESGRVKRFLDLLVLAQRRMDEAGREPRNEAKGESR